MGTSVFGTPASAQGASGSFNIGVAANDRLVNVFLDDEGAGGWTSVTVDGKACTQQASASNGNNYTDLWTIDEAALGSSNGTVTVAHNGPADTGIRVIVFYGVANDTAIATPSTATASAASSVSVAGLTASAGAVMVCMATHNIAGSSRAWDGSSPAGVTRVLEGVVTTSARGVLGYEILASAYSSQTVSLSVSGGTVDRMAMVLAMFAPAGASAYTLTAAPGTFALSGQAAALKATRALASAAGSFSLSGQAAILKRGLKLGASSGAFTLSGQAATLRRSAAIVANAGAYVLAGQAVALRATRSFVASAGAFTLSGKAAGLVAARKLTSAAGSFLLSGKAVTLTYQQVVVVVAAVTQLHKIRALFSGVHTMQGRFQIIYKIRARFAGALSAQRHEQAVYKIRARFDPTYSMKGRFK